jgi:hypothetical protein
MVSMYKFLKWLLFLYICKYHFVCTSLFTYSWYVSHQFYPLWFDHPFNVRWRLQIMKFDIVKQNRDYVL